MMILVLYLQRILTLEYCVMLIAGLSGSSMGAHVKVKFSDVSAQMYVLFCVCVCVCVCVRIIKS